MDSKVLTLRIANPAVPNQRDVQPLPTRIAASTPSSAADAGQPQEQDAWREENRDAIESYNALVARDGAFSDAWRRF